MTNIIREHKGVTLFVLVFLVLFNMYIDRVEELKELETSNQVAYYENN